MPSVLHSPVDELQSCDVSVLGRYLSITKLRTAIHRRDAEFTEIGVFLDQEFFTPRGEFFTGSIQSEWPREFCASGENIAMQRAERSISLCSMRLCGEILPASCSSRPSW